MAPRPSFSLSKWYLDLIAADGETAIVYAAKLRLGGFVLHYASLLHASAEGRVRERTALEPVVPDVEEARIRLRAEGLDVAGQWQPLEPEISDVLLERPDASLSWRCVAPRASAALSIDGRTFEGLGYVEVLSLDIPPWELPIHELRWGRALTERESLVWIDWRGPHSVARAYRSGVRVDPVRVDDDELEATGTRLRFSDNAVLREGTIGSTALAVLGARLRSKVPASALLLDERKWRARIELDGASGFAIHEVVRWP